MKEKNDCLNRRNFLRAIGAAGLGATLASAEGIVDPNAKYKTEDAKLTQVPRRKLGKTGIDVSCLSLGTGKSFDLIHNQAALKKALQWGVNYWDTSPRYNDGTSEEGIGIFFKNNPQLRKDIFLVDKATGAETVEEVEKVLQRSLKTLNTNYIDMYYVVHGCRWPEELTDELKQWAADAKKRGLIRYVGFSTHKNMAECLAGAAKLDWIDAIMTSYNFYLMQEDQMQAGIEACYKAGIGLIAMKTQGRRAKIETEKDKEIVSHFLKSGFTEGQAKIKAVLEDKRISSACVGQAEVDLLTLNIAAVLDKTSLSQADFEAFRKYAKETCDGYCAGCSEICDGALPDMPYVSDIMRYLMYYNSYGETRQARELFREIPAGVRKKLLKTDYSLAEARCPQHLAIGELMAEAVSKLA